ncbi:MAG TPA: YkgJ family cysteine cluster protein [Polyangiaceae bacterium]|nr:YkgJ family cysteine cluster protein [Polyangiaceae bacterium]
MSRVPTHRYADPLDRIWLSTARAVGLRVERTADTYASTPGNGVLLLADRPHLDADDSLAQMILHEICHSLVEGKGAFERRDWGLDNETERDVPREHACLRLQAFLAGGFGLRRVLAPTTDYRAFYDALRGDPFSPRHDPTAILAVAARRRADQPPWAPHLMRALAATRAVVDAAAAFPESARDGERDLLELLDAAPGVHPSGLRLSSPASPERTCGVCAWRHGRAGLCRQADDIRVAASAPACERFEPLLDCQECGACCRAAYDCVEVTPRDPVRKKHPELVVVRGPFLEIKRNGDRCAALGGGVMEQGASEPRLVPYACGIYADRPRSCRDFENAGEHCLTARRRVGLSL